MNYYIEGNPAKSEQIKAAFESKGFDVGTNSCAQKGLYFTFDGKVCYTYIYPRDMMLKRFIKNNPDYKELELPKPHYDIANFKPFDKVLGRNCCRSGVWRADYFSHIHKNGKLFVGIGYTWEQCIPFNDDTKHLLGTTDPCDEQYKNW